MSRTVAVSTPDCQQVIRAYFGSSQADRLMTTALVGAAAAFKNVGFELGRVHAQSVDDRSQRLRLHKCMEIRDPTMEHPLAIGTCLSIAYGEGRRGWSRLFLQVVTLKKLSEGVRVPSTHWTEPERLTSQTMPAVGPPGELTCGGFMQVWQSRMDGADAWDFQADARALLQRYAELTAR